MTLTVLHSSGRTGFELPALLTAKPMRAPLAWLRILESGNFDHIRQVLGVH